MFNKPIQQWSIKRRFSGQRVLSPSDSWEFVRGRQKSRPRQEGREDRPHARRAERRPCLKPIELRHLRWTETTCSQPVMCPLNVFKNSSNKPRFSGQRVLSPSDSWEFIGGRQRSRPRQEGREDRPHARRAERRPCLKPIELRHLRWTGGGLLGSDP